MDEMKPETVGKIHALVGSLREAREIVSTKAAKARADGKVILKKHGEILLNQAIEFVEDVKKTFL